MSDSKQKLTITKGGAVLLRSILPQLNWYKGIPLVNAVEAQMIIADQLSKVGKFGPAGDMQPFDIAVGPAAYQGIRSCVKFYLDHAALELKPCVLNLIDVFKLLES